MKNKTVFILLMMLITSFNSYATTIPLYIPSAVTSELSRVFYKKIKEFEKLNPEINIKFHAKESYEDVFSEVLENNLNKKSSGVIIAELSELPTLVSLNAIIGLDDFICDDQELLTNILPSFLYNSYENKKLYALPMFRSTPSIYYNLDILKQVTNKAPLLLAPNWFDWIFESFVIQSGGSLSNEDNTNVLFNSSATIEALTYWKELKDEGLLTRSNRNWKSTINMFFYQAYPIVYYSTGGMVKRYNSAPFNKIKEQLKFAKSKIMTKNYSKVREVLKKAINRSLDIAQSEVQRFLK